MAYRRTRRSPMGKRKRNFRKRRGYRSRKATRRNKSRFAVTKMVSDIPDRLFVKLQYVQMFTQQIAPTTPACTALFYSSLFAPYGTGHQPYWFDQWTPNIYTRYRVYGIKYDITVENKAIQEAWWYAVRPQNTAVAETNMQTLMERKDTKWRMGGAWGSNRSSVRIKGYMSVAKTMGLNRSELKNEEWYAADYNASPVKMAILACYLQHNNAAAATFESTVKLTYYAELFGKAVPAQS